MRGSSSPGGGDGGRAAGTTTASVSFSNVSPGSQHKSSSASQLQAFCYMPSKLTPIKGSGAPGGGGGGGAVGTTTASVSPGLVRLNQPLQASCKHPAICHVTDNDSLSTQLVRCPLALGSQSQTLLATGRTGRTGTCAKGGEAAGTPAGHHLHAKHLLHHRTQLITCATLHKPQQIELSITSTEHTTYLQLVHTPHLQASKESGSKLCACF